LNLLYIAAPYRAKTIVKLQHNIYEASKMAQYYWHQGFAVICPHKNSANFDGLTLDKVFLQGTMLMLSKCSHIAIHPKWSESSGSITEYEYAIANKLIIHFTEMVRVNKFIKGL
jgi:hypothetical protein